MVSASWGTPLLEADNVVRRFGARTVVNVERLHVHAGEVLAVVGPNGAGKSTLFRTLLLLERPDAGTVRLGGQTMRRHDTRARGRLAGVFQRPVLFSGSVSRNVAFGLRAAGVSGAALRDRTAAALEWLELNSLANAPVHSLSGGEAQRVALARALALEPQVVLLDEPTANLDVAARRRFRQDVERVARQRARSVVLITHDAMEAFGMADRIAVMHEGRVVQIGTPDEIMLRPKTPFVAELTGAELLLHGRIDALEDGGLVAVRIAPERVVWAAVAHDASLTPGAEAVVSYRPEDVVLSAPHAAQETSAVNRVEARIDAIVPAGALVRVRLRSDDGTVLTALLTRRSTSALELSVDTSVIAHLKAAALHAWPRDSQRH